MNRFVKGFLIISFILCFALSSMSAHAFQILTDANGHTVVYDEVNKRLWIRSLAMFNNETYQQQIDNISLLHYFGRSDWMMATFEMVKTIFLQIPTWQKMKDTFGPSQQPPDGWINIQGRINDVTSGGMTWTAGSYAGSADGNIGTVPNPHLDVVGPLWAHRTLGAWVVSSGTFELPTNTPPVAVNDSYTVSEDTVLTISAPGLLGNDTDAEKNSLTAIKVSDPTHAKNFVLNSDGSFTYEPSSNFFGTDSFTYKASDGSAVSDIATVTINVSAVNDPPVANNDSYTVNMYETLTVSAPGILSNDTDSENETLTAKMLPPSSGSFSYNMDGSFDYTPSAVGTFTFTYKANDGHQDSNEATVKINVLPVLHSGIIYVKKDATGTDKGTSWSNAYTDLQAALSAAVNGDEIWVAKGVYTPTSGTGYSISFKMKNGVKIYGGFSGNEIVLSQRNWKTNKTVLSGDIDSNDTVDDAGITTAINGNNSFTVIRNVDIDNTAVLDGFVITGGNANCGNRGGENHIYERAFGGAGGMMNSDSTPTITNCSFSENLGGGLYNNNSSPKITNCSFSDNDKRETHAKSRGGGIFNDNNSKPIITNCSFSNNAASNGGGMCNDNSDPTIINCSFSNNAASNGGGMINYDSSPKLYNSILWGNSSEIVNVSSSPEVYYSTVKGGWTGVGSNNKDIDPLFVNAAVGNLRLQSFSPAINAGNNSYIIDVTADLYGNPRITDATVDMGVYESPSVDINGDGVIDIKDLNIIKANLNKFRSACPKCDLDNDGKITVLDAKKLMNMCSCPNCVCP